MTDLTPEEMIKWNPELAELLKGVSQTQIITSTTKISDLRAMTSKAPKSEPWPEVMEEDKMVKMRDGVDIKVRTYSPTAKAGNSAQEDAGPLMVWFHGGGYCAGSIEAEEDNCREFCKSFGGVAVNVDYRLAPEWKFPTAINDAFDALKWVSTNWDNIWTDVKSVDPQKGFLIGGISAGGTLATICSHLYRDAGLSPSTTGLFASVSTCIAPGIPIPEQYRSFGTILSWKQNEDAPLIGSQGVEMFQRAYEPILESPLCSPLLFPTGHSNLPATYFQICGLDPMRDYGLLYENILRNEGIHTKVDFYPGLPHGFWAMAPQAGFTKAWKEDKKRAWSWLLSQSVRP